MDQSKYFLITIDTEGDNQWDVLHSVSTENALFLPRFQELSEKYGLVPTWLTNYEMALDKRYVEYMKPKCSQGLCEIGAHLHAWYNPPEYILDKSVDARPYLIEYPDEIMLQKLQLLFDTLQLQFDCPIRSHRSGRWALDDRYVKCLEQVGATVDCSVTPHCSWQNSKGATGAGGSDYSEASETPFFIGKGVLELPMTIRKMKRFTAGNVNGLRSFLSECKHLAVGRWQWLRPGKRTKAEELIDLVRMIKDSPNDEYAMFMIHSSELMPGCSPSFPDCESIEHLYAILEELFRAVADMGFIGIGISSYSELVCKKQAIDKSLIRY